MRGSSDYDRELRRLDDQLDAGSISRDEYDESVREIERDYREAALEAAENARQEELRSWEW